MQVLCRVFAGADEVGSWLSFRPEVNGDVKALVWVWLMHIVLCVRWAPGHDMVYRLIMLSRDDRAQAGGAASARMRHILVLDTMDFLRSLH